MKNVVRFVLLMVFIFVIVFILVFVFAAAQNEKRQQPRQDEQSEIQQTIAAPLRHPSGTELRAVWVPYMALSLPEGSRSEKGFRKNFDRIVKSARDNGFNALIVHVRAHGDALYPSKSYPWSHYLTGVQGQDPGYDPLAYMVEAAHKAGLSFHAWVNPFRIQTAKTPEVLSADNPHRRWSEDQKTKNDRWTVQLPEGIFLNPAYAEVRAHIIDGVREIVTGYDVDGIHFDDYFYPVGPDGENLFDGKEYDAYCESYEDGTPLSLLEWRTANVNALVSGVYAAVKAEKPSVQFGISPPANFDNCRDMAADVRTWGSSTGYVDYLCPQVYFSSRHQTHPFEALSIEWSEAVTAKNVKLYIGLALYKAGTAEEIDPGWSESNDVIARQILFGRDTLRWDGFMVYSCEQLNGGRGKREVENMKKRINEG